MTAAPPPPVTPATPATRPTTPPTAPKPTARPPRQQSTNAPTRVGKVQFVPVEGGTGHRVAVYGPGGIGKSTLCAIAPGPVAFFDLDESLPRLAGQLPEDADVKIAASAPDWQQMRDLLHADGWDGIRTIVIDSATRAEELAAAWVIANVPHEKKDVVIRRIEDYGFGKGYQHIYETFLTLLGDLDQHARVGRNVILACHECTTNVPNPTGEDWLRFEPRLQSPSSGKSSIRLRVKEWADHLLFIGYDVDVRDGKGRGGGTRTIWPCEQPHCMAKSRTLSDPLPYERHDRTLWQQLLG